MNNLLSDALNAYFTILIVAGVIGFLVHSFTLEVIKARSVMGKDVAKPTRILAMVSSLYCVALAMSSAVLFIHSPLNALVCSSFLLGVAVLSWYYTYKSVEIARKVGESRRKDLDEAKRNFFRRSQSPDKAWIVPHSVEA